MVKEGEIGKNEFRTTKCYCPVNLLLLTEQNCLQGFNLRIKFDLCLQTMAFVQLSVIHVNRR